jgi:hypothetical protein
VRTAPPGAAAGVLLFSDPGRLDSAHHRLVKGVTVSRTQRLVSSGARVLALLTGAYAMLTTYFANFAPFSPFAGSVGGQALGFALLVALGATCLVLVRPQFSGLLFLVVAGLIVVSRWLGYFVVTPYTEGVLPEALGRYWTPERRLTSFSEQLALQVALFVLAGMLALLASRVGKPRRPSARTVREQTGSPSEA